jgi:ribosomal protein S18 acetylase RimI-like enzyme
MHAYTLRPYTYTREDAAKLALLWNDAPSARPSTLSRGRPATGQEPPSWMDREQGLFALVADDLAQHRFVGFGSMCPESDRGKGCYVSVVSLHPAAQGDELTRQMLTRMIDQAGELGYHRVSLSTRSANPGNAPLYEAVGFFQVPGTRAPWSNYVPLVRQHPLSQQYFRRHDWSSTLQHNSGEANRERRPARDVYHYHWTADGETLLITIDRNAETITGVETERFAAHVEVDELPPGGALSYPIRWRVTNKGTQPLNVSVMADGDHGVRIAHRSGLIIPGGNEQTIRGRFTVAPDLLLGAEGGPGPQIRTVLVVGAQIVELGTGVRPPRAVLPGAGAARRGFVPDGRPERQRHSAVQRQPA